MKDTKTSASTAATVKIKTVEEMALELVAYTMMPGDDDSPYTPESWHKHADSMPVRAARVSHGQDGKTGKDPDKDLKLMRYLAEHKHLSPFEHQSATFLIECPIFVAREWHRHRTQCISGDSKITCFDKKGRTFKRTIKSIYDLKYGGVVDNPHVRVLNGKQKNGKQAYTKRTLKVEGRVRVLPNCQSRTLRVLNEDTLKYLKVPMLDVMYSGKKEVFLLETLCGRTIKTTADHKILTESGWKEMREISIADKIAVSKKVATNFDPVGKYLRSAIGAWTTQQRNKKLTEDNNTCYICNKIFAKGDVVLDHVVPVSEDIKKSLDVDNLKPACYKCHRLKTNTEQTGRKGQTRLGVVWSEVVKEPTSVGIEDTYDISMPDPWHNFEANGIVVHNCFNEISRRYTETDNDVFWKPSSFRKQATRNKQSSAGEIDKQSEAYEVLRRSYERAYQDYQDLVALDVCREQARSVLPVGSVTRFYATANLRNWAHWHKLRVAEDSQYEIRVYANRVGDKLKDLWPDAWSILTNVQSEQSSLRDIITENNVDG